MVPISFELLVALLLLAPPEPGPAPEVEPATLAPLPEPERAPGELPDLRSWRKWPVWPTLLAEIDGQKLADEAEGNDGFALGRFRVGLRGEPLPWLGFVATVELARESPGLLDAYVLVRPTEGVTIDVGFAKAPLLASFYAEPVHAMATPDRAPVVVAFRTRRDLGIGLLVARREVPLELRLRVGNGAGGILGNDNPQIAGYGALDLVLGRARRGGAGKLLGMRLGVAGMYEHAAARNSIQAVHPLDYVYVQPVPIEGPRAVGEAHLIGYAGPARLVVEAAIGRESRRADLDGDPDTPTQPATALWAGGITTELDVVVLGLPREVGLPPAAKPGPWRGGALELSARFDGMAVNRHAPDVAPGGSLGGALAVKWWPIDLMSLAVAGYGLHYDRPPVDQPDRRWSWGLLVRLGVYWGIAVGSDRPKPVVAAD